MMFYQRIIKFSTHKIKNKCAYTFAGSFVLSFAFLPYVFAKEALLDVPLQAGMQYLPPNVIVSVDNSGSMGLSGLAALKDGLKNTFNRDNVGDGRIRLAWQAMWGSCRGFPTQSSHTLSCPISNYNRMGMLEGQHRDNFLNWVDSLPLGGGTPSHIMVKFAGDYLMLTGRENPWANVPGSGSAKDSEISACRKSFHIFMTDGAWNRIDYYQSDGLGVSVGNFDNLQTSLPDGAIYKPMAPYKDNWGSSYPAYSQCYNNYSFFWSISNGRLTCNNTRYPSTLSDLAFYYWAQDLQPQTANQVLPYYSQTIDEMHNGQKLTPYWNPKNDPATWQHLNTYTIGYNNAAVWSNKSTWPKPWKNDDTTYSASSYSDLISGALTWPDPVMATEDSERKMELWHMALNSRAQFYPARTDKDLQDAFQQILKTILAVSDSAISGLTSSSQNISDDETALIYKTSYNSEHWSGRIHAFKLTSNDNGTLGIDNKKPLWRAEEKIAAQDWNTGRNIFTYNPSTQKTVAFRWNKNNTSNMNAQQNAALGDSTKGEELLNYLRGESNDKFRSRGTLKNASQQTLANKLGDITTLPWLSGKPNSAYIDSTYLDWAQKNNARTPLLLAGANDGMMHAFHADAKHTNSGEEVFAYVPLGVYSNLKQLSTEPYSHKFYLGASPFSGDIFDDSTWKTYLISPLGAGAKGYFVLDITKRDSFLESNPNDLVVLDHSFDGELIKGDPDIGHIFQDPSLDVNVMRASQIVKMNNERWAVIFGNGVNSENGNAVLLIQFLDGAKETLKIATGDLGQKENGLSAPSTVDADGDGMVDLVYAGDLKGNVWRFDLATCKDKSTQSICTGKNAIDSPSTPIFVTPNAQAITVAPLVNFYSGPIGGKTAELIKGKKSVARKKYRYMVTFGTGRLLTQKDINNTDTVNTIYSILDLGAAKTTTRDDLVQHKIGMISDVRGTNARSLLKIKDQNGNYQYPPVDLRNIQGWYLDFPASSERVTDRMQSLFYKRSTYAVIPSLKPNPNKNPDSCTSQSETNYTTILNVFNGHPFAEGQSPVFDFTRDGLVQFVFNKPDLSDDYFLENLGRNEGIITAKLDYRSMSSVENSTGRMKCSIVKDGNAPPSCAPLRNVPKRLSWRELIQ